MDTTAALAIWAAFPVHSETRPIVITGPLLHDPGFVTGEAKQAYHARRLRIGPDIPTAAAVSLTAQTGPLALGPDPVLDVLTATRVRHPFRTDRGEALLDAWSLQISDTLEPVTVVDHTEQPRMWPDPDHRYGTGTAYRLDRADTHFRFHFIGSPRRYADFDSVDVVTGDTAVVVAPRLTPRDDGSQVRLLYAETRQVEFHLPAPLGHRVLIDTQGNPIEARNSDDPAEQSP